MGKALALALLAFGVTACQPMYKDRAETLRNPPPKAPPKVVVTEPEPAFVDTCNVNFSAPVAKKRAITTSQQQTSNGDSALQTSQPGTPRPSTPGSVQSVTRAIDIYRQALISDPYNAEATLKLALAYDRVLRKGCALAMLHRLETLASNDKLAKDATPMIDLVVQNPHWFKPYHPEALKAVGR